MFSVPEVALNLGKIFQTNGYELALVGGSVRDMFLKKTSKDFDFATNARPDITYKILSKYLDDIWDIGKDFGTIGGNKYVDGQPIQIEVTTYRTDKYDSITRRPVVQYGETLDGDLSRRDFTINCIAVKLPEIELIDPFKGIDDLQSKLVRTPIDAELSFEDDPLRMLRAIRFAGMFQFKIEFNTKVALSKMVKRMDIVSAERIRDELVKIMMHDNPCSTLEILMQSELNAWVLPEVADLQMEIDPKHHHKNIYEHSFKVLENAIKYETEYLGQPDLIIRLAALLHDIGKPRTRRYHGNKVIFQGHDIVGSRMVYRRLKHLKFDKYTVKSVARLVELHMRFFGYGDTKWTDSAVRRYAHDAGEEIQRLHVLVRSDVTTQNRKKMNYLAFSYDNIEERIIKLQEQEELLKIRPDLNGNEIIALLGLEHGKHDGWKIGKAYDFLLNYRIENGPQDKQVATELLLKWAKKEGFI